MPTISRFHGLVIEMYFNDHVPPHFHARGAGRLARVRIDEENWRRARNDETLIQIEPLR